MNECIITNTCCNCGLDYNIISKGAAINQCASLTTNLIVLLAQISEWEKLSRKTPLKTLKAEWDKVRRAKDQVEAGKQQALGMKAELDKLCEIANWHPHVKLDI